MFDWKTKEGIREYNRQYRQKNRERINFLSREWKRKNKEKLKERQKLYGLRYKQKHPKRFKESQKKSQLKRKLHPLYSERIGKMAKKQREKFPLKIKARGKARQIKLTSESKCTDCGSKIDLHKHHEDYNKPLDVKILCRDCHNKL